MVSIRRNNQRLAKTGTDRTYAIVHDYTEKLESRGLLPLPKAIQYMVQITTKSTYAHSPSRDPVASYLAY